MIGAGPAAKADLVQLIRDLKKHLNVTRVILTGGSLDETPAQFRTRHSEEFK